MAVRHDGWTDKRRTIFLETLARTANVTAAAAAAGKAKATAYALRKREADFAAQWDDAIASAMDELEAVAYDRATNGVPKVIVRTQGEPVTIVEYSDRLLMFMLSRRRPALAAHAAAEVESDEATCAAVEARVSAIEARRSEAP
jgi:hypothetical protein